MKNVRILLVAAGLCTAFALPVTGHADDDHHETEAIIKQFGLISPDEAKAKALAAKPGVVTDTDLDNRDFGKGWDYEFEIVDADGKEWEVDIDAKTGAVRHVGRDWF